MADKIRAINDQPSIEAQTSLFDLIFPKQMRIQAGLTDGEAGFLYNLWKNAPVGSTTFAIPASADVKEVTALKTKGYLAGFGEGMELTDKGKKVIVEMVTHEPNSFEKHAQEISYSGIKSKTAGRPRQSLLKKQASKAPEGKSFNLRRASIKKMGE